MKFLIPISVVLLLCSCGSDSESEPITEEYTTAETLVESSKFIGSILVKKGNTHILRKGFGFANKAQQIPNGVDTRFRIASLTKAFTALAIVQLKQSNVILSYDDPVSAYITDYPNDEVTIRQLLTHTSGITDYLSLVDDNKEYLPTELIGLFKDKALEFIPGTKFSYSNSNYFLLGHIIEQLSGMDYFDYLNAYILMPLGMNSTEYASNVITGDEYAQGYTNLAQSKLTSYLDMSIPFAAGALSSNLVDFEAWGESFLSKLLISEEDVQDAFPEGEYGFGWFVTDISGKKVYIHSGGINGFSTVIAILPDDEGLIVAFSNINGVGENVNALMTSIIENEF